MIDKTISWDDYRAIEKMNPSTLVAGCKSMLHLRNRIRDGFGEPSKPMRFGSGVHTLLLEPEEFEAKYVVMPSFNLDDDNRTADGKPSKMSTTTYAKGKSDEFRKLNSGKIVIDRVDYDRALCCIEAIHAKPQIAELLETENKEVTVIGEICGVECKGRIDILCPGVIADLKNTDDLLWFDKVFNDFEYAFKLSMYWDLVRQNTCEREVKVIAQETKGDFDNILKPVPKDFLELSLSRVMNTLERYKQCKREDVWPGVDGGELEVPFETPYWAKKKAIELDWTGIELSQEPEQEELVAGSPF